MDHPRYLIVWVNHSSDGAERWEPVPWDPSAGTRAPYANVTVAVAR